ncbi:MAG TPA: right-handed parallel beta-helix repeat-containing protein [Candidatus Saccharimonadales bacterium]|nr:right-handed parallel beta-helix repeat-containing protein [Candidatus Saccharimonadales bacterium]
MPRALSLPRPPRSHVALLLLAVALLGAPVPSRALDLDVPTAAYPTIQDAITAIVAQKDPVNSINLIASPVVTGTEIRLDLNFNSLHRLVIRPKPGIASLPRAEILSNDTNHPILSMSSASFVTLEDLDLIRGITNNCDLVALTQSSDIVIQRCRVGSISPAGASSSWSYLQILYPTDIVVRNCIFFSTYPGALNSGITAVYGDNTNSLRLYNNVVASHGLVGIHISSTFPGSLVLLRNNVVVNDPALLVEPYAYASEVDFHPLVISTHNVAFASAAQVEALNQMQNQSVAGNVAGGAFLAFSTARVAPAFVTHAWSLVAGDENTDFYRPTAAGDLHDNSSKWGITVGNGTPTPQDLEVWDDVWKAFRPGGVPAHTDRGAYQLDPGVSPVGVPGPGAPAAALWAAPRRNPGTGVGLDFAAYAPGRLTFEVLDPAGRLLHREARAVGAGESGALDWSGARGGVLFYRVRLEGPSGAASEVRGKVVVVR